MSSNQNPETSSSRERTEQRTFEGGGEGEKERRRLGLLFSVSVLLKKGTTQPSLSLFVLCFALYSSSLLLLRVAVIAPADEHGDTSPHDIEPRPLLLHETRAFSCESAPLGAGILD